MGERRDSSRGVCRGEDCGATFEWAVNETSGKGVPLDREPVPDGRFVATGQTTPDGRRIVRPVGRGEDVGVMPRYHPHHVSCPNSDDFRTDKPRKR